MKIADNEMIENKKEDKIGKKSLFILSIIITLISIMVLIFDLFMASATHELIVSGEVQAIAVIATIPIMLIAMAIIGVLSIVSIVMSIVNIFKTKVKLASVIMLSINVTIIVITVLAFFICLYAK